MPIQAATIVDRTVLTTGSNDVVLDGCQILNKEVSADKTKARVIVWLNANGVCHQNCLLDPSPYLVVGSCRLGSQLGSITGTSYQHRSAL